MKKVYVFLSLALIGITSCSGKPGTNVKLERARVVQLIPDATVSNTAAARSAAACAGWPKAVIPGASKLTTKRVPIDPAPYFYFPNAKYISIATNGSSIKTVPARVVSLTPMRDLGRYSMVMKETNKDPVYNHMWILIMERSKANGVRTFVALEGTPAENFLFETHKKIVREKPSVIV